MPNNPLIFLVISNTSDFTACVFLIILIAAMATSENRDLVPDRLILGSGIMLAGIACRLLARSLTSAMRGPVQLTGMPEVTLEIFRIAGFILILLGTIEFFAVSGSMFQGAKTQSYGWQEIALGAVFLTAGLAGYLVISDDRIWSAIMIVVLIIGEVRGLSFIDGSYAKVFFSLPIVMACVAFLIVLFFPAIKLTGLCLALMYVIIYIQYTFYLQREIARKDTELAESRLRLLTGQISPHFMFNSLQVIQALCDTDPGEVKGAIGMFASYLRGNLESLTSENLIPFTRELEHAKAYIALEQLGEGRRFDVEYRLGFTNFMLPPLTLQPLVENAVRYGIGTASAGERIVIETLEDSDSIVIAVKDNGTGKNSATSQQKSRRSIGIENVRARLDAQCQGTLDVNITDAGTVAVIRIPKAPR